MAELTGLGDGLNAGRGNTGVRMSPGFLTWALGEHRCLSWSTEVYKRTGVEKEKSVPS
jgi:hypothetical protein